MEENILLKKEAYRQARVMKKNLQFFKESEFVLRNRKKEKRLNQYFFSSLSLSAVFIISLITILTLSGTRDCVSFSGECLDLGLLSLFFSFLTFLCFILSFIIYSSKREIENTRNYFITFVHRGEILLNQFDDLNKEDNE